METRLHLIDTRVMWQLSLVFGLLLVAGELAAGIALLTLAVLNFLATGK